MIKELVRSKDDTENLTIEEILASIRGIISDDMIDNAEKKKPEEEDVLELVDEVADTAPAEQEIKSDNKEAESTKDSAEESAIQEALVDQEVKNAAQGKGAEIEAKDEVVESDPVPTKSVTDVEQSIDTSLESKAERVISPITASKAAGAIKDLIHKTQKPHSDGLSFRSGVTVEDLIVEAMKPYLVNWMDINLPGIVKNLVEKEIRKLVPRDE